MTDTIIPNTPDTSIGIVRTSTGVQAVAISNIRYAGIERDGHRFVGVYQANNKANPVMTHTTGDQLNDLPTAFSSLEWVASDHDIALDEMRDKITAINADVKTIAPTPTTFIFDAATESTVADLRVDQIDRGDSATMFSVTLTGFVTHPDNHIFPVNLTVAHILLEPDAGTVELAQRIIDAIPPTDAAWEFALPEKIRIDEYHFNQWHLTGATVYIAGGRVDDCYETAFEPGKFDVMVVVTTNETSDDGEAYEREESHLWQMDGDAVVYTDLQHSIAAHYATVDMRRKLVAAYNEQNGLAADLETLAESRETAYDDLMTELRATAPGLFATLDAIDAKIADKTATKSVIDATVETTEKGIKESAVFFWNKNGRRDDDKTSDDGAIQVAVLPNLELNSPVLAYEWAVKNKPGFAVKSIDLKKAVKYIRDNNETPAGCTRTETVYGKIVKSKLFKHYDQTPVDGEA